MLRECCAGRAGVDVLVDPDKKTFISWLPKVVRISVNDLDGSFQFYIPME